MCCFRQYNYLSKFYTNELVVEMAEKVCVIIRKILPVKRKSVPNAAHIKDLSYQDYRKS